MNAPEISDVDARQLLRQYDMQVTQPRIMVLEDLMRHHIHATADDIYHRLNAIDHNLSRASVYNILNALVEKHAVRAITVDDKQTHYDIVLYPHAHFRCTRCGKIMDIPMPSLGETEFPKGCKIESRELYYTGLCPECANETQK